MAEYKPILVADDSEVLRSLVIRQLERLGFPATAVGSGREAIEAAKSGEYSLILMDCAMPDIDGLEATQTIRQIEQASSRHTPIIAMTASAMSGDRDICIEAGMDDYFSKPFGLAELQQMIRRWVSGEGREMEAVEVSNRDGSPIDMSELAKAYGTDGINEMLDLFSQEMHSLLNEAADCLDRQDFDNLARVAHQVKGVSTFIVADSLRQAAVDLEESARARNLNQAKSRYDNLVSEFGDVTVFINQYLSG